MRIFFLLCVLLLAGCGVTVEPPAPVVVRFAAGESTFALAEAIGAEINAEQPQITVEGDIANATLALAQLAAGEVDFAVVSTLPPGAEQFRQVPVARQGVAIIVHPDNPLDNLTLLELQRLYAGSVFDWRDVQGMAGDVQPVVRERGSGIRAVFEQQIMNGDRVTPNARVLPNSRAVVDFVAQNPSAIGYVSQVLVSDQVKVLAVEDITPAPETVANGAYPLTHLVYVLTVPDPQPEVLSLLKLFSDKKGQDIVEATGSSRIK